MQEKNVARGLTLGLIAYLIWGSFPIIISSLAFANPFEIVVWRIVFGFLTAVVLIALTRKWKSLLVVFKQPKNLLWIAVSSVFIYINWQVYVIGVNTHHVVESSLGYFINPLFTILIAVVFLREKLSRLQWIAVGFGASAVIVLTFDYGRLPWIALTLAGSFGIYGLAKNQLGGKVSALNSFAIESAALLPLAAIQAAFVAGLAQGIEFGKVGLWGSLGLIFFGVMTAVPLILFGSAARHLPLSFVGFLQYLTPILQFSSGLLIFHEAMPPARWLGFGLVWAGLALLSFDLIRRQRQSKSGI